MSASGLSISSKVIDGVPARALGSFADVLSGISIPGRVVHRPDGRYLLILPRNVARCGAPVDCGGIPAVDRTHIDLDMLPAERALRPGDVLFISRGESNRAAVVAATLSDREAIASSVFHVLRPDPAVVDPAYLAWSLNQALLQRIIAAEIRTSSVSTPMVPRKDLEKLSIPLPSLDRQRNIARLGMLMLHEASLRRRLADLTDRRNAAIGALLLGATPSKEDQS